MEFKMQLLKYSLNLSKKTFIRVDYVLMRKINDTFINMCNNILIIICLLHFKQYLEGKILF